MKCLGVLLIFGLLLPGFATGRRTSASVRFAMLDLAGDEGDEVGGRLRTLAGQDHRLSAEILDPDLVRLAVRGTGYQGSLNLSRSEARALGQSLGCDFYVLGKVLETRRQTAPDSHHFESQAGIFLVEARTGNLLGFFHPIAEAADAARAHAGLIGQMPAIWTSLSAIMLEAALSGASPEAAQIEVFRDQAEALGEGTSPPVFYRQLKPAYPEEAAKAEITATVELTAVFQADGKVGEVEVQRWAGYGLDDSAVRTVRQLSFQPATRHGKPVPFRGLVRYNFRRPSPQAIRSSAQSQEEIDRLKSSLRDILKSKPVPD